MLRHLHATKSSCLFQSVEEHESRTAFQNPPLERNASPFAVSPKWGRITQPILRNRSCSLQPVAFRRAWCAHSSQSSERTAFLSNEYAFWPRPTMAQDDDSSWDSIHGVCLAQKRSLRIYLFFVGVLPFVFYLRELGSSSVHSCCLNRGMATHSS